MNAGMLHRGIPFVWVLTSGEAGMRSQALGLAEALGWPYEEKRYDLRGPWRHLPAPVAVHLARWRWGGAGDRTLAAMAAKGSDVLTPPWPDVLIACGRRVQVAGLLIKQMNAGRTFLVYIQDPRISPRHFDLVIALEHDLVRGSNVVTTPLALHRFTPQRLQETREQWLPLWDGRFPRPWLGVLVGGPSRSVIWDDVLFREQMEQLLSSVREGGGSVFATVSRRTPTATSQWLCSRIGTSLPGWVWTGQGENPYHGILSCADGLAVTLDSVSMLSEAIAARVPVTGIEVGRYRPRLARFHELITKRGWLSRVGEQPTREPELGAEEVVQRIAEEVRAYMKSRLEILE